MPCPTAAKPALQAAWQELPLAVGVFWAPQFQKPFWGGDTWPGTPLQAAGAGGGGGVGAGVGAAMAARRERGQGCSEAMLAMREDISEHRPSHCHQCLINAKN
jgi:hypothetical protein